MAHQRIASGSTVRINCREATGINGKLGTVKEFNPAGKGIYTVTMPDLQFRPSFLFFEELEVVSEAEAREVSAPQEVSPLAVVKHLNYDPELAKKFAYDILEAVGHEINYEDGYDQVFDLGGE